MARGRGSFLRKHEDLILIRNIHIKFRYSGVHLYSQLYGGRNRQILEACPSACLEAMVGYRFGERLYLKK